MEAFPTMPPPGLPTPHNPAADAPRANADHPWLEIGQGDRRIQSASASLCAMSGWAAETLLGAPWQRVFALDSVADIERSCSRCILSGTAETDVLLNMAEGGTRGALLRVHFDHRRGVLRFVLRPVDEDQVWPKQVSSIVATSPSTDEGTTVMQALNIAGAAALEVDADGSITDATPALERLLNQPLSALRRQRIEEVFAMSEPARAAFLQARQRHQPQSVLAACATDNRQVVVEWMAGSRQGSGFAVVMGAHRDLAGMERLRAQSRLVSLVAHDVRDSLSAVNCGLQSLAEELGEDSKMLDTVALVRRENERATRIAHDVLWMSRPGNLDRVELDIDTVVHEMVERYRGRATQKGVGLVLDLSSGEQALADLTTLDRCLSNVIDNALDATPAEGQVTVSTRREGRGRPGVLISIRDTGEGIPLENQQLIFDPFVSHKRGGTGLGLAIASRVALDHGGQIAFDSPPGQGATFHIWLPALRA